MEKAEQQWEQEEEEEEEEALRGRQPRHLNHNTTTTSTVSTTVSSGHSDHKGKIMNSTMPTNEASDSSILQKEAAEELKISNNDDAINDVDKGIGAEDLLQSSESCVYHDNDEGNGFTYGCSVTEHSSIERSVPEKNPGDDRLDILTVESYDIRKSLDTVFNHRYEENLKHDSLSGSSLRSSEISFEEHNTGYKFFSNKVVVESADINLIRESNDEATGFDIERVLEKQDTHDLYCPNCNSCITRRVIIRKRKRKIRTSDGDTKRNKLETVVDSELGAISANATNSQARNAVDICLDGNLPPAANDYDHDREPDIFRCLSCFSIFIPTGNGFKLFRMFGDKIEKENMQDPQQMPAMKKSWFSSIFSSDKGEVSTENGSGHRTDVEKNNVGGLIPSSNLKEQNGQASPAQTFVVGGIENGRITEPQKGGDNNLPSSTQGRELMADVEDKLDDVIQKRKGWTAPDHSEVDTANQLNSSSFFNEMLPNHESDHPETKLSSKTALYIGEPAENAIIIPSHGLKFLTPSNVGSSTVANLQTDQKFNATMQKKSADEKEMFLLLPTPVSVVVESDLDGKENISACIPCDDEQNIGAAPLTESVIENTHGKLKLVDKDGAYHSEVSEHYIIRTKRDIHTEEHLKVDRDVLISSAQNALLHQDGHTNICEDLKDMPAETSADGAYPIEVFQHNTIRTKEDIHTEEPLKVDRDTLISSVQNALLLQDRRVKIGKDMKDKSAERSAGKEMIINIEAGQVEPAASQRAQYTAETGASPNIETQIRVVEQKGATAREVHRLDIIKSIVYGGLIESITSLGVVSSAAGADAATLNVLALGLANLIGGLFVIGHRLWELKNDHTGGAFNQGAEQVDQYQELLGRRADFLLHGIVAVFSFLIFGLLPPLVYGFAFRKSNDRDLKLVAVAATSLVCIVILAAGKAYVQRPPKSYFKTVVYYISMGLMVSGVSYVVGSLIDKLLEKLGLFQSSLVVSPLHETRSMKPAWASY